MPARCTICHHERRAEIERASAEQPPTLEGRLHVAQTFAVSRATLEKHLEKCKPLPRRRGRKSVAPAGDDAPPDSGSRPVPETGAGEAAKESAPVPPPPPRPIGSAGEELERYLQLVIRKVEGEDVKSTQIVPLIKEARQLITALQKLRDERPIDEHPAFEALVEDLVAAVVEALGPRAPEGIEAEIAEAFERRQAERLGAASPLRRAA